jgi:hypothetical protein
MLSQSQYELIERLVRWAGNFDTRVALVGATFANLDFLDFKISAGAENLIEHLREDERIYDVPA